MAKKQFFLIVDIESTINDKVFDFAAVVVDRKGEIFTQCAVVVHEFIEESLFYIPNENGHWGKANALVKHSMIHGNNLDTSY